MRRPFHKSSPAPSIEQMAVLLKKHGIDLNRGQLDQLWRYHNLLRKRNQDRDLTRITGFEPMVVKHYVDCMIVGKLFHLPTPLLDVGTGAGFPGIPLKIRYPNLKLVLAEPRPRRVEFLKESIALLDLKHIEVFDHKVVSQSFTKPVKGVITRAVEDIEKTLLRTSGCVGIGSQLIFMKGPNCDAEIEQVEKRFRGAFNLIENHEYRLPGTEHERRLVVYEKVASVEG